MKGRGEHGAYYGSVQHPATEHSGEVGEEDVGAWRRQSDVNPPETSDFLGFMLAVAAFTDSPVILSTWSRYGCTGWGL